MENHILAHPDVHDVAIVSMPDEFLGERTCAFLIPHQYECPPTVAGLRKFLREREMADYKIPDRMEFIESFPKTRVGKVDKKALREMIAQKINK